MEELNHIKPDLPGFDQNDQGKYDIASNPELTWSLVSLFLVKPEVLKKPGDFLYRKPPGFLKIILENCENAIHAGGVLNHRFYF